MRYTWPCYLPSTLTAACTFFQPVVETILSQLRESPVLESCARTVAKPVTLKFVPLSQFACPQGVPFTLSPRTETRYLSLRYPKWAAEATILIGVAPLSPREFLQDLAARISGDEKAFHERSADWHSHLSTALFRLAADSELIPAIMEMRIIPLQDGTWTSAKDKSIFFSKAGSNLGVPSGIDVLVVDAKAEADPSRRKLYATLGVRDLEVSEICRLVLQVHGSPEFNPESLTTAQLVSHAKFLYDASWQPPSDANLWFATTQDKRSLGKDLYIFGYTAAGTAASRVFARLQHKFPVIHSDYLRASDLDTDFHDWLVRNLKLSRIPRLVTPEIAPKSEPMEGPRGKHGDHVDAMGMPDSDSESIVDEEKMKPLEVIQRVKELNRLNRQRELSISRREREEASPIQGDYQYWQHWGIPEKERHIKNSERMATQEQEPRTREAELRKREAKLEAQRGAPNNYPRDTRFVSSSNFDPNDLSRNPFRPMGLGGSLGESVQAADSDYVVSPPDSDSLISPSDSDEGYYYRRSLDQEKSIKERTIDLHLESVDGEKEQGANDTGKTRPDTPRGGAEPGVSKGAIIFNLSEEYRFLFGECSTSDVLQLLRDNWRHYSRWIDGAHMEWQTLDFLESSSQLKHQLRNCIVQTTTGSQLALHETVLPGIDRDLERGCSVPAVPVNDPSHPDWRFLTHLGVLTSPDVHYYLRCLAAVAGTADVDADAVAYLYEKIQTHYQGNETCIRYYFLHKWSNGCKTDFGTPGRPSATAIPSSPGRRHNQIKWRTRPAGSALPNALFWSSQCIRSIRPVHTYFGVCSPPRQIPSRRRLLSSVISSLPARCGLYPAFSVIWTKP